MLTRCLALCLFFSCSSFISLLAQENLVLGLEASIALAKEKSLRTKSNYAFFESMFWRYKSASASRFASLNLNGSLPNLSRRINTITQPDGTILFIPQSNAVSALNMTIEQPIMPIGGSVFVSTGLNRIDIFDQGLSYWQSTPLLIGINLPLFDFNRNKWNWRQEKLYYSQSGSQLAESMEQLSIDVTEAFFNWYTAELRYQNSVINVSINDSIFTISQGRYSLGKIAENELLQVELNLLNAQYQVTQTEFERKINADRLKLLIGISRGTHITADSLPKTIDAEFPVDKAIAECLSNTSAIVTFQINENNALMQMKDAGRKRYISGSVSATFGLNQTGVNFGDAYSGLLNSQTATVDFSIPLYNFGRAQADFRRAEKMVEATRADIDFAKANLELDIYSQVMNLEQLKTSAALSEKAYEIAMRRYDVTKNRFLIGKVDITNLTIAQSEKDGALFSYVETLRAYWRAYYTLRKSTLFDFIHNKKLIEEYTDL